MDRVGTSDRIYHVEDLLHGYSSYYRIDPDMFPVVRQPKIRPVDSSYLDAVSTIHDLVPILLRPRDAKVLAEVHITSMRHDTKQDYVT